jgi:hypothetical protein
VRFVIHYFIRPELLLLSSQMFRETRNECSMNIGPELPLDYYYLPRDVWIYILQKLKFRVLVEFTTVSSTWREMVYEGITSFDGLEADWLDDAYLERCPNLKVLDLRCVDCWAVTNAAVQRLKHLTHLTLNCYDSITDAGIQRLTNLLTLGFSNNCSVTNAGVAGLQPLTALDLSESSVITDEALSRDQLEALEAPCNWFDFR